MPWQPWAFDGNYNYAAGTATATVDIPADGRLRRVSLIAGTVSASTIVIGAGGTIVVPAGYVFDEVISGASINQDVVIAGGTPQSYYVSWVT